MSLDEDRVARIVAEADQMINEIQRQLDDGEEFYRQQGIDREKMQGALSPRDKEEAARLLAEDMAAVEREVEEAKARLSFSTPAKAPRSGMRRNMI